MGTKVDARVIGLVRVWFLGVGSIKDGRWKRIEKN